MAVADRHRAELLPESLSTSPETLAIRAEAEREVVDALAELDRTGRTAVTMAAWGSRDPRSHRRSGGRKAQRARCCAALALRFARRSFTPNRVEGEVWPRRSARSGSGLIARSCLHGPVPEGSSDWAPSWRALKSTKRRRSSSAAPDHQIGTPSRSRPSLADGQSSPATIRASRNLAAASVPSPRASYRRPRSTSASTSRPRSSRRRSSTYSLSP